MKKLLSLLAGPLSKVISMLPVTQLKIALVVALASAAFTGGWKARGWQEDAVVNAQAEATQEFKDQFHEHEAAVALLLDDKLSKLKANRTIVEKRYEKIVDRPVYRNICLDDDGLRLLDAARLGAAPASAPAEALPRSPE